MDQSCTRCGEAATHYSFATYEAVCCRHYYAGCTCRPAPSGEPVVVGRFRWIPTGPTTGDVEGPATYMAEQGNARLDAILAGRVESFNRSAHLSPSVEVAVLVSLQTDYAAWAGERQVFGPRAAR